MHESVCVIVPARGRQEKLGGCLDSLLRLKHKELEIILVDDGLEEFSLRIAQGYSGKITIIKSNGQGASFARNLAARATQKELLAFTDSDCIVDPGWLDGLLQGLREFPDASACGGAQDIPADAGSFEKKVFLFMRKTGLVTEYMRKNKGCGIREVEHNASCCVLYKREDFLKAGGFLEGLWPGEDVELDFRMKKMGLQLVFNPQAIVYHYRPGDIAAFTRMMFRYGFAQGLLVRRFGIFRRMQLLPFLGAAFLVLCVYLFLLKLLPLVLISAVIVSLIYFRMDFLLLRLGIVTLVSWDIGFWKGLIQCSRSLSSR